MKFKGEPNLLVRINKNIAKNRRLKNFRFDNNGIYETDNPRVIKALSKRFEIIEDIKEEIYQCKKCDYKTKNKGELLAHYKTHKKV